MEKEKDRRVAASVGGCPECGGFLRHEGGCSVCMDCGWSPCG